MKIQIFLALLFVRSESFVLFENPRLFVRVFSCVQIGFSREVLFCVLPEVSFVLSFSSFPSVTMFAIFV
jgi:hypothetical protein